MLAKSTAWVKVPATSANLGPGFDVLGLSLSLHDELTAEVIDGVDVVEINGEGATELPLDASHLVLKSLRKALELVGEVNVAIKLTATNRIPQARGLGSSSAAIVAGILLAQQLVGAERLSQADVINLAGRLEGHPDNIAPCILGGMTIAWMDDDGHHAVKLSTHPEIIPVIAIADFKLPTAKARGVLPLRVSHDDAVFNLSRSNLLIYAMTQDPDLLFTATEDKLHQRQRADVMPDSLRALATLRRAGHAAVISGAGPTVLTLATKSNLEQVIEMANRLGKFQVMRLAVDPVGAQAG